MSDLVAVEADIDVFVTLGDDDDVIHSLCLSSIRNVRGKLRAGHYKATVLMLHEDIQEDEHGVDSQ